MNSASIAGRITRNIELKTTASGKSVIDTNVAVRRTQEETDFINVQIWGNLADVVSRYCRKGQFVAIDGKIRVSEYTDRDGNKRTYTYVLADSVDFDFGNTNNATRTEDTSVFEDEMADVLEGDDDLPF